MREDSKRPAPPDDRDDRACFASPPCAMHELAADFGLAALTDKPDQPDDRVAPAADLRSLSAAPTAEPAADWPAVCEWRRMARARLLTERRALPRGDKTRLAGAVTAHLKAQYAVLAGKRVGFYWPMKGELDLVPFVRSLLPIVAAAALPVVVAKGRPLEFWQWSAGTVLCNRGVWNIPIPAERVLVEPDVLLVPLLGFDPAGYRLGYGGGYYDRTLAAFARRPLTIGVGHDLAEVDTIFPQPHDVRMDRIVTESGVTVLPGG